MDHPHAGGENFILEDPIPIGERTIPTRVGRTTMAAPMFARVPDHPHAGGENRNRIAGHNHVDGPSPRGWGELIIQEAGTEQVRTIPTRVGRTPPPIPRKHPPSDHPHAGGENLVNFL